MCSGTTHTCLHLRYVCLSGLWPNIPSRTYSIPPRSRESLNEFFFIRILWRQRVSARMSELPLEYPHPFSSLRLCLKNEPQLSGCTYWDARITEFCILFMKACSLIIRRCRLPRLDPMNWYQPLLFPENAMSCHPAPETNPSSRCQMGFYTLRYYR